MLNPRFCEGLMGFALGWTAFERLATPLSQWSQHMRSRLSSVLSSRDSGEADTNYGLRAVSVEEWRLAVELVLEELMTKITDDDGGAVDATFHIEEAAGRLSIVFHARGGTGDKALNTKYAEGLTIILERLRLMNATLVDAVVDSRTAAKLPWEARQLHDEFPMRLRDLTDMDHLRRRLSKGAAAAGRPKGAKGGGNNTKRVRLFVSLPRTLKAATLEAKLAEA